MTRAFWYLTGCSLRNRVAQQARRLSNPRYAIALLLGVSYFWFLFGRQGGPRADAVRGDAAATLGALTEFVFTLLLVAMAAKWWLFGGSRTALAFTPAEIQFLFPAPISRGQRILFKLLRLQLSSIVSALLFALWVRSNVTLPYVLRFLSFWMLFSILSLHQLGATLAHERLTQRGVAGHAWRRALVPALVAIAAFGAIAWGLYGARGELREALQSGDDVLATLLAVLHRYPAHAALLPVQLLLAPLRANNAAHWALAMLPAVALTALHYPWVLGSDVAYEDAALEATALRAQRIAAIRRRGVGGMVEHAAGKRPSRAPWRLAMRGRPEIAIVWKNLTAFVRVLRPQTLLLVVVLGGLVYAVATFTTQSAREARQILGIIALLGLGLLSVAGPMWVRNDLRQDLVHLDIIRAWPLGGAAIVGAEIAATVIVLSGLQYACLVLAWFTTAEIGGNALTYTSRATLAVAAALLFPTINLLTTTIHNATALLFPAWVRLGAERATGIEATGQGILTTVATSLALLLLLVVPLAAGGAVTFGLASAAGGIGGRVFDQTGTAALLSGVVVLVLAVGGEVLLVIRWLGRVFERTDPATAGVGAAG